MRDRAAPAFDPLAGATFSRLTDWPGEEGAAEISPDGKFVAFSADVPLNDLGDLAMR